MWATTEERDAEFAAAVSDIRIDITVAEEGMEETPYIVTESDIAGNVIDRCFYAFKEEAYQHRIAHRESESRHAEAERLGIHPLEIEFAPFGPAWQREQDQRRGVAA